MQRGFCTEGPSFFLFLGNMLLDKDAVVMVNYRFEKQLLILQRN